MHIGRGYSRTSLSVPRTFRSNSGHDPLNAMLSTQDDQRIRDLLESLERAHLDLGSSQYRCLGHQQDLCAQQRAADMSTTTLVPLASVVPKLKSRAITNHDD